VSGKKYSLPELPYGYKDLEPYISEALLTLHHQKHHQSYVNGANALIEKMEKARNENADIDIKASLKELSFHLGGNFLHTIFWQCMAPSGNGGGGEPSGKLAEAIKEEFGSYDRFKKEFTQAASGVEGSGWAVLVYCKVTGRLFIQQVEKHNVNIVPSFAVLMALDIWEHAFYLDYKNEKAKFIDAFWNIVNWSFINKRFESVM
jgi:superoxide dismutase, Fe-Mn family